MNKELRAREESVGEGARQASLLPKTNAEGDRVREKKERCQKLYQELLDEVEDLGSSTFRPLWFARARVLREVGCWWHYSVLLRKGREYLRSIR